MKDHICYIVVRDRHPFTANKVHESLVDAQLEAERLCKKEADTFLLFALIGEVAPAEFPVKWDYLPGAKAILCYDNTRKPQLS